MKRTTPRLLGVMLIIALIISIIPTFAISSHAANGAITVTDADGWFESAYAEWSGISGADGYNAYVSPASSSSWAKIDNELVRNVDGVYRVDAIGLTPGEYKIKIVPTFDGTEQESKAVTTDTLTVMAYDRSGYAHFNYTDGVGAYNDDGTLKDNAIVLYVTESTKNTVSVTSKDGTTVTGIGNILGSTGMDVGDGKNSKGGLANTNSDILKKLAKDGTPLVVRIIGRVSGIGMDGLTAYNSVDYGGSVGDNGYMARMSGGKDITIEGIGSDAVIDGWGLHFICHSADYASGYGRSFEVRNISFQNVPEDCVGMEGQQEDTALTAPVERCWIHHCSFYAPYIPNPAESDKSGGDGACDFKRGMYFTNSYCYYEGYHKTNLVGSSDTSLQYHMTYHHNYWKNCESRGPLARQANIHMYNNIFEGQSSYCMNPRANAYIFSEFNMFINCKNPVTVDLGGVKSYGDSFLSCIGDNNASVVSDKNEKVDTGNKYANFDTDPTLSYIPSGNYDIQEDLALMKAVVLSYAGTRKEKILSPEDVDTSLIPENRKPTAPVSLPYEKALTKSYVSSNGTKDSIVFNVAKFNSDSLSVGGNANGTDIVFYVNVSVNVEMTAVSGSYLPVLANEYGEVFIIGSGATENLPAGYYFIQSAGYDPGSGKFKEAKISGLKITRAVICDEHSYDTEVSLPTCTESGHTTYVCKNCGYTYVSDTTEPLGHTPGDAASCITPQICQVCDAVISPTTDHDYVDGSCITCGTKDPTVCTHSNVTSVVTAPTCKDGGYTTYKCETCDYSYTGNDVAPLGHTPGASPTCTTAQTCTVCFEVIASAKGHSFADGYCSVCNEPDASANGYAHSFTESGTASEFYAISGKLSEDKGSVDYNGLSLTKCLKIESSTVIEFTAPRKGTLTLVFGGSVSTDGKNISIDGTLHDIGYTGILTVEVSEGKHTVKKGGVVSLFYIVYIPEKEEVHTHEYESSVTKASTCTETGVLTYTCSCGDSYTEEIPANGHTPGNKADCENAQTCTVCREVIKEALGHKYENGSCTECGKSTGTDNPVIPLPQGDFFGVSLHVGANISINYHVTPGDGKALGDYSVRFTVDGKEPVLVTQGVSENGEFIFTLKGILYQQMTVSITAELICGDTVVDVVENYSVKQYVTRALDIYNSYDYSSEKYVKLRQLLSDMLYYGSEMQKYLGYNTDDLATEGVAGILDPLSKAPDENDKQTVVITESGADTASAKFIRCTDPHTD